MDRKLTLLEINEFKIVLGHELIKLFKPTQIIKNIMLPKEENLIVTDLSESYISFSINCKDRITRHYSITWSYYEAMLINYNAEYKS